ncbi:MAG: hypothetical protein GWO02_16350 [Gammaproteobacteria bacterium]|nr:hypothetical protein [Gammaproteobacteria bacterium]
MSRNRWIVGSAIGLAAIAVAIDHTRHPLPEPAPSAAETGAGDGAMRSADPCGLGASPCGLGGDDPCGLGTGSPCGLGGDTPCGLGGGGSPCSL